MKRLNYFIGVAALTAVLTGCEPYKFGMPETQFESLTPEQQSQVIDAYNKHEQTRLEQAPLMEAIGVASGAIGSHKHTKSSSHYRFRTSRS